MDRYVINERIGSKLIKLCYYLLMFMYFVRLGIISMNKLVFILKRLKSFNEVNISF